MAVRTSIDDLAIRPDDMERRADNAMGAEEAARSITVLRGLLSAGTTTSPGASDEDN